MAFLLNNFSYLKNQNKWLLKLDNGLLLEKDLVVICASFESKEILKKINYELKLEPILGQAVELELKNDKPDPSKWPGIISTEGINLILKNKNRLIIGATLEPGEKINKQSKYNMLKMNNSAPNWLKKASIKNEWFGIRAKPIGRPAPILEDLGNGLILNTGHYRNGILLAPACAEWVAQTIIQSYNKII